MKMKSKKTERGFGVITFKDRYEAECSLQDSSLATEPAIWLGVDDPKPVIMASEAAKFGVATEETTGWVTYPVPAEVNLTTRMHLTQKQVKALLPFLKHFAKTGDYLFENKKFAKYE
jgi:hypothetical protein